MKLNFFLVIGIIFMNMNVLQAENSIKKEVLSNGIVLIHKHNPEIPVVGTLIFLKMGTIDEPKKLAGISNLLQSVIIKGTKNRTAEQISEEIESLGGTISADSNYDYSELSCAVGKQYFEKSIEILSDIFLNPIFPEQEIEKEKMNIIAGIISRKDNIFSVAVDELLNNIYKNHPYGRLEEGEIRTVKRLKRKDIYSWWEKFYAVDTESKNVVIVVCGDIDFESAKNVTEKYFNKIRKIKLIPRKFNEIKIKEIFVKKKTHFKQGYLMYGYLSPELSLSNIKEYLSLKLLNTYLGGGMSGKLFQKLREENSLCYETSSFYPTRLLESHFVIYLGLDAGRMNIAKENIEKIILELKSGELFTENDLTEVKQKFKGRFLLDHQTNLRQGWYLGFWEIMGLGYEFDNKYIDEVYKINIEDIRNVITKTFNKKKVVVELQPK